MLTHDTFDLIIFGVTGFTGKMVVEYLLKNYKDVPWAVCVRDTTTAETMFQKLCGNDMPHPTILEADWLCYDDDDEMEVSILRSVIQRTRLVLACTTSTRHCNEGQTLVGLCAEEGVDYADITGEPDFVRSMVCLHDATARYNNSSIISHCGEFIPHDLLVYEMNRKAVQQGYILETVLTLVEVSTYEGRSVHTIQPEENLIHPSGYFDPLLTNYDGKKSENITNNISPVCKMHLAYLNRTVEPWDMAPVMVDCIRRSNALLHYNSNLQYGDCLLIQRQSPNLLASKVQNMLQKTIIVSHKIAGKLCPGWLSKDRNQAISEEATECDQMTLHGYGQIKAEDGSTKMIHGKFCLNKRVDFLYTAAMLVEAGMTLIHNNEQKVSGVVTPAACLGHALTQRLSETLNISFDIETRDFPIKSTKF